MVGPLLELRDVTKRFGSTVAVDRLSLTLEPGEIHA
ncbi:MAG: ABC transporter ATP-binding protein, partial [Rhizobiaceae bacterium]